MTAFFRKVGEAMNSKEPCLSRKQDEFEKCVLCWKTTDVLKSANIQDRTFYVEGVGQLCKRCWEKTYYGEVKDNI